MKQFLENIYADFSAAVNGAWRSLTVDNLVLTGITAPTNATVTSTAANVRGAASVTVLYDITGATTGIVVSVFGGVSGFGFIQLRSVTASAGLQGFRLGNATTGGAQDSTGISRVDDIFIQATLAANTGNGTGVLTTLRTRFLTQPSS